MSAKETTQQELSLQYLFILTWSELEKCWWCSLLLPLTVTVGGGNLPLGEETFEDTLERVVCLLWSFEGVLMQGFAAVVASQYNGKQLLPLHDCVALKLVNPVGHTILIGQSGWSHHSDWSVRLVTPFWFVSPACHTVLIGQFSWSHHSDWSGLKANSTAPINSLQS